MVSWGAMCNFSLHIQKTILPAIVTQWRLPICRNIPLSIIIKKKIHQKSGQWFFLADFIAILSSRVPLKSAYNHQISHHYHIPFSAWTGRKIVFVCLCLFWIK